MRLKYGGDGRMPEITKYQQGMPSWMDLATTDLTGAEKFYGGLFGWEAKREPAGEGRFYSMQYLKGKTVAGIMEQSGEQAEQGVPASWYTYITVEDADAVTAKVGKLGGRVISEPFDVFDSGRMAVIQDPEGAFINLWQAKRHIGAQLVNEPGTLIWNELVADDTEKLASFYGSLLDIEMKPMEGMPEYKLFTVEGKRVAGIFQKGRKLKSLPSHWSIYFAVEDTERIAEKTQSLGGAIITPPVETQMGCFSVLQDPQGALFQVITAGAV
jgi:predicted enzyme related to lactoylglutathione lyase